VIVAASGAVSLERMAELASRYLRLNEGPSRNGKFPMTRFRSRAVTFEKEVTQVSLALAGRGPSYNDDDRHALAIVNMILGAGLSSRLFQRIREEEGLAYTIYSFLDVLRDTGLFGVYIGVAPENTRRCLDLTCREIRRLKKGGVRRWEIESARAQLLMSHFLAYESTYERMNRIAQSEICYGRQAPLDQIVARIQGIGEDEVRNAIDRYLQPQRFSVVTVGPPGGSYPRTGDWDF
jgi:predicted Zn-dependent peptidase